MKKPPQAITWLRAAGYQSVSVDLIYGLPLQTEASFAQTIADVITLNPDRLAVFSYAHVPWLKPAQKIFDTRDQLPTTAAKLNMLAEATRALSDASYEHIGMDHFARPDDELAVAHREGTLTRNFQGYTTRAGASLYGFGLSSISQTDGSFRQNHKDIDAYRQAVTAGTLPIERGCLLTDEDRRRRTLIMAIMCRSRVSYRDITEELGIDIASYYAAEIASLDDLEADGLLQRDRDGFDITPVGELFRRIIAMRFDAYLNKVNQRFSKTV
ncbi:MAG: hypothetical protein NVV74_10105 [Magnetospirillum sp.]|nr:hypothetical protein [Magnetospirillum sp.]